MKPWEDSKIFYIVSQEHYKLTLNSISEGELSLPYDRLAKLAYLFCAGLAFLGGVLLLSGSGGFLPSGRPDFMDYLMNASEERVISGVAGGILVSSPLILLVYLSRARESKRGMGEAMNHHSRNRVQAILLRLELLESDASPRDLPMIKEAERSCYALIDSIEEISTR
jgi:hypothetical protein